MTEIDLTLTSEEIKFLCTLGVDVSNKEKWKTIKGFALSGESFEQAYTGGDRTVEVPGPRSKIRRFFNFVQQEQRRRPALPKILPQSARLDLRIDSVKVVQGRYGPDHIMIETNLPAGTYPFTGQADLKMTVAQGSGVEYVRKHFGVEPEVIESPKIEGE